MSSATFQCNYFADDRDLLNLPEARGGEPIMADAWRQQGSSRFDLIGDKCEN